MKNKNVRVERRVVGYGPVYEADVREVTILSDSGDFCLIKLGDWDKNSRVYKSCLVKDARYRNIKIPTI